MALDFSFSPEHEAVRETVRRLCQDEVAPLVRDAEETETFPRELFRTATSSAT
jgi:alkylation response protein AidB-like acyl-CoA dehydrogenase